MEDDCWLSYSVRRTNPTTYLETVDIWHVNVENDGVELATGGLPDGTLAVVSADDDVTEMLQSFCRAYRSASLSSTTSTETKTGTLPSGVGLYINSGAELCKEVVRRVLGHDFFVHGNGGDPPNQGAPLPALLR